MSVFSPLNGLVILVESQLTINVRALNFIPLIGRSIFVPVLYTFYYCNFIVSFDIKKNKDVPSLSQMIPPNFSLFNVVLEMRKQRPAAVQTEVRASVSIQEYIPPPLVFHF